MFIIQIGAADGKIDAHRGIDEVYQLIHANPDTKAVLVEPNPFIFAKLLLNYDEELRNGQVQCVPVAIARHDGVMPFFCINGEMEQASTGLLELVARKDYYGGKSKDYRQITVNCMSINTLLRRHHTPDYLVIDAEGFDGPIMEQLNLKDFRIPRIRFEFSHIEDAQLGRVCLKLLKADYDLHHDKADIVAVKQ